MVKMVSVPLVTGVRSERRGVAHFPRRAFVLASCSLLCSLLTMVFAQQEDELEALKMLFLNDLGMKKVPDMSKVNTSPEQLKEMVKKYERMVSREQDEEEGDARRRRAAKPKCNRKTPCCLKSMKVNFKKDLGMDWVVQPLEVDLNSCTGRCAMGSDQQPLPMPISNTHGLFQGIMTKKHGNGSSTTGLCCVPTKLRPLVLLHYDDREPPQLVKTKQKGVVVKRCGCT